jgi:catechol 2,3-dioxygenase-like lactoylglutathione lyase family enzyme
MNELISGIQQVGIGVSNANLAWQWYRKTFGLNVPIFNDVAEAKLMSRYTEGEIRERHAIMALSMAGGGGVEIWQYTKRTPTKPESPPKIGDLGIFCIKIKSLDVSQFAKNQGKELVFSPENIAFFWQKDDDGNQLQVVQNDSWFKPNGHLSGGICGAIIGVSDMEKSLELYRNTLNINTLVYDKVGVFDDFQTFGKAGKGTFRRILLRKSFGNQGAFSRLLGGIEIELVQCLDRQPKKIFEDRNWGDTGFIHICFDALDMDILKEKCRQNGFPFTVDSADSFDMGEAAGRFSYIEDPDGSLIEFVETHKVPVLKKLGIYLNLKKRKTQKPLPDWMVSTLGWSKVKD